MALNFIDFLNTLNILNSSVLGFCSPTLDTFLMASPILIKPWFITGITDGDGCFSFSIIRNKGITSWLVIPSFTIGADINPANYQMLSLIKAYFGGIGHINIVSGTYNYHVMGLKNCLKFKNHFINYPLMTYKLVYFKLWVEILDIMSKNQHLTESGLLKIVSIKSLYSCVAFFIYKKRSKKD